MVGCKTYQLQKSVWERKIILKNFVRTTHRGILNTKTVVCTFPCYFYFFSCYDFLSVANSAMIFFWLAEAFSSTRL